MIIFIIAGFGNGIEDAAWNALSGNMANANEVLGFLHGFYGLGAVLSDLAATTLMTKSGWASYELYYIMVNYNHLVYLQTPNRVADWWCCNLARNVCSSFLAHVGQKVPRRKPSH